MHKVSKDSSLLTFRPIISTIRTYNYNLAKHKSHLLSPHIPKQFCTLDSFSFVEGLKKINISTSGSHFLFDGEYYDQTDGVAMGSPLVPILTNIFVAFHEQTWINNCSLTAPLCYKRYVDDIIAISNSEHEAQEFFKHLNKQHKNLKFTMEKEQDNQIVFLDVLLKKSNSLLTSVYHKKTYTGLLQKILSFIPSCYKLGLVRF
ncbi:uncharacterized protein LOC136093678 [Hydra vulgaris]|uniref:uncharacterized protein LOC136093678 n=1 Tax=Hydra vulgaris TaxID=6087 RepID=UPI0032EA6E64